MKKIFKIIPFLMVAGFTISCDTSNKVPLVLSLDLSDGIALFNSNNCTKGEESDFRLYKIDSNGVTKRVAIKTSRSEDDKYFTENVIFTDVIDVSKDYFYAHLGRLSNSYCDYFVNKKTGKAYRIDANISSMGLSYWQDSTSTIRNFPQDKDGNIYGCVYDYSAKSDVLAKFTITEQNVKYERIINLKEFDGEGYMKMAFNSFAVDDEGNAVARALKGKTTVWTFVTPDKKEYQIGPKEAVWKGYDGAIYAYKNSNIEKLTFDKDKNEVETEVVRSMPQIESLDLLNMKLLYLDKTQQIFAYSGKTNENFNLYQIYGENLVEKSYTPSELSDVNPNASSSNLDDYGLSSVTCDEDCIYFTGYDGNSFTVNKIDTSKDMEFSQTKYEVEYNDGVRFLSNKKMLIFWWGHNEINTPSGESTACMSVSIFDINTGTMSKQDKFVAGIADRTNTVDLLSY